MLRPYQCLEMCGDVLIASSISYLDSFNIEDGLLLSRWSYSELPIVNSLSENTSKTRKFHAPENDPVSGSASKRKRESSPGEEEIHESKEKIPASDEAKSEKIPPTVIALASTKDARHLIAVTGEDKTIRVFEHDGKGKLQQVSQRPMPKRPCALAITADDSTIICADKFGDVYSLPLLYSIPPRSPERPKEQANTEPAPKASSKPFIPAANNLTVHSERNLRALQSQLKQAQKASEKPTPPDFERKLLLGHVSMLTDIAVVERLGRSYIVTADRDEHIRISRGIPQAHIIERYCLGHREFVSRICFPTSRPNILISGGGDDDLYVWDWDLGERIQNVNLRRHVEDFLSEMACENDGGEDGHSDKEKIAVSSIVYLGGTSNAMDDTIVVACEGIPALFVFNLVRNSTLCYRNTLRLGGNPLDLIAGNTMNNIIVSMDYIHEPGSTTQLRNLLSKGTHLEQLQTFQVTDSGLASTPFQFRTAHEPEAILDDTFDTHHVSTLLYSIGNMRKRGGED